MNNVNLYLNMVMACLLAMGGSIVGILYTFDLGEWLGMWMIMFVCAFFIGKYYARRLDREMGLVEVTEE